MLQVVCCALGLEDGPKLADCTFVRPAKLHRQAPLDRPGHVKNVVKFNKHEGQIII